VFSLNARAWRRRSAGSEASVKSFSLILLLFSVAFLLGNVRKKEGGGKGKEKERRGREEEEGRGKGRREGSGWKVMREECCFFVRMSIFKG
jgi:hypothetical protein